METLKSSDVYDDGNEDSTEFIHTQPLTGATNCLQVSWVRIPIAQMQKLRSRRIARTQTCCPLHAAALVSPGPQKRRGPDWPPTAHTRRNAKAPEVDAAVGP